MPTGPVRSPLFTVQGVPGWDCGICSDSHLYWNRISGGWYPPRGQGDVDYVIGKPHDSLAYYSSAFSFYDSNLPVFLVAHEEHSRSGNEEVVIAITTAEKAANMDADWGGPQFPPFDDIGLVSVSIPTVRQNRNWLATDSPIKIRVSVDTALRWINLVSHQII